MENKDLKYLKKHYGENFAHLCRTLFPTILEEEGKLSKIISENFADSHSLYDALKESNTTSEFKNYIYSKFHINKKIECKGFKSPYELFDKAGYILYPECETEEDIQKFKKYYKDNEKLCTFNGGRLDYCRVWFAVKKNVDEIKRENFKNPRRQDEYGTSVISIQYTKEGGCLSIKNRYNHTVNNPDATFSNNLDNIIPELSDSFESVFKIEVDKDNYEFYIPNYVIGNDGKRYRYAYEVDNIYYCENNVVLDRFTPIVIDKSSKLLIDNFIVDFKEKTIKPYAKDTLNSFESFTNSLGEIKDIKIENLENGKKLITIIPVNGEQEEIVINKRNQIIEYKNPNVQEVGNYFLAYNKTLLNIELKNCKKVGDMFLGLNGTLKSLNLESLEVIDNHFLMNNDCLENLELKSLKYIYGNFMNINNKIKTLELPNVEFIGDEFLIGNRVLTNISLPNVLHIGSCFMNSNKGLTEINFPKVTTIENFFLMNNTSLKTLILPQIEFIGYDFMYRNEVLSKIYMPKISRKYLGNDVFSYHKNREELLKQLEINSQISQKTELELK